MESAEERVNQVQYYKKYGNRIEHYRLPDLESGLKQIRWMNLGDEKILLTLKAVKNNKQLPSWAIMFQPYLSVKDNRLYYKTYRFLYSHEKRKEVKRIYFNPKLGATISTIYDEVRSKFANLTKKDVANALKGIETYSRNLPKQKRPDAAVGRYTFKKPGILMFDLFFPSAELGWRGSKYILTCMDYWSSFVGIYALDSKDKQTVKSAAGLFLKEFIATSGVLPRRAFQDRGTDLAAIPELFERFRQKKDKNDPMVIYSQSGGPVHPIEAMNRLVGSRMQIFRTSKLSELPEDLTKAIQYQLNYKQRRPNKNNMTPVQLLSLGKRQQEQITKEFKDRTIIGVPKLQDLQVGERCRVMLLTRKQQVESGISGKLKSYAPKWSQQIYTILKRTRLRKNKDFYAYTLNDIKGTRFRHELLHIPSHIVVDASVPVSYPHRKEEIIGGLYEPDSDESDI